MQRNLLRTLVNCSEKAANIARKIRADEKLLSLLVEEKSESEANPRFVHDFKTLADVLIQETVRYDVCSEFPELKENIFGEEEPVFTNSSGETVHLRVDENQDVLKTKILKLLDDNTEAAELIVEEVYRTVVWSFEGSTSILEFDLKYEDLGIWIDPIDATQEYIKGESIFTDFPGITSTCLDCVTVLIGVFNNITGDSIIGVINQPFHTKLQENLYNSKIYWGISLGDIRANNIAKITRTTDIAIFSSSESTNTLDEIKSLGYELVFSAGAGHKILKVITNEVDFFLLTKSSTYVWDTCAPNAILNSLGGGIVDLKLSLEQKAPITIAYTTEKKTNNGGLIAYANPKIIDNILDKIKHS